MLPTYKKVWIEAQGKTFEFENVQVKLADVNDRFPYAQVMSQGRVVGYFAPQFALKGELS